MGVFHHAEHFRDGQLILVGVELEFFVLIDPRDLRLGKQDGSVRVQLQIHGVRRRAVLRQPCRSAVVFRAGVDEGQRGGTAALGGLLNPRVVLHREHRIHVHQQGQSRRIAAPGGEGHPGLSLGLRRASQIVHRHAPQLVYRSAGLLAVGHQGQARRRRLGFVAVHSALAVRADAQRLVFAESLQLFQHLRRQGHLHLHRTGGEVQRPSVNRGGQGQDPEQKHLVLTQLFGPGGQALIGLAVLLELHGEYHVRRVQLRPPVHAVQSGSIRIRPAPGEIPIGFHGRPIFREFHVRLRGRRILPALRLGRRRRQAAVLNAIDLAGILHVRQSVEGADARSLSQPLIRLRWRKNLFTI